MGRQIFGVEMKIQKKPKGFCCRFCDIKGRKSGKYYKRMISKWRRRQDRVYIKEQMV